MERTATVAEEETFQLEVDGKSVRIVTRAADDEIARLFDLSNASAWSDESPLTEDDATQVVRRLLDAEGNYGEIEVVGVAPATAARFPDEPRISVSKVEPVSFSLPGSPQGLALKMDERGDAELWAVGSARVSLGREGMWWVVNQLIDALEDPARAARWPRILVLGTTLGGPAAQASVETGEWGVGIAWRRLDNGSVEEVIAVNELTYERVAGWLAILTPFRDRLLAQRAHRQRLPAARLAEKWVRALERWSR